MSKKHKKEVRISIHTQNLSYMVFQTKDPILQNLISKMIKQKLKDTYMMIWVGEEAWKWTQKFKKNLKK